MLNYVYISRCKSLLKYQVLALKVPNWNLKHLIKEKTQTEIHNKVI